MYEYIYMNLNMYVYIYIYLCTLMYSQARDRRHVTPKEGEFDYAAYAANRLNAFHALM